MSSVALVPSQQREVPLLTRHCLHLVIRHHSRKNRRVIRMNVSRSRQYRNRFVIDLAKFLSHAEYFILGKRPPDHRQRPSCFVSETGRLKESFAVLDVAETIMLKRF